MTYLARHERRAAILEAAVLVVMKEGMAAATVRRIAHEIDAAAGQIHHHFGSASELRAEAFATLTRRSLEDKSREHEKKDPTTRLLALLGYSDTALDLQENNLWNEAMLIAQHDEAMESTLAESIKAWHREIVMILAIGKGRGSALHSSAVEDAGWRLIGLSNGLYGMMQLETLGFSKDAFNRQMLVAIESELRADRQP